MRYAVAICFVLLGWTSTSAQTPLDSYGELPARTVRLAGLQSVALMEGKHLAGSMHFDSLGRKIELYDANATEYQRIRYLYDKQGRPALTSWLDSSGAIVQFIRYKYRGDQVIELLYQTHESEWFQHSRIKRNNQGTWLRWSYFHPNGKLMRLNKQKLDEQGRIVTIKYMLSRSFVARKVQFDYRGNGRVFKQSTWYNEDMMLPAQIRKLHQTLDSKGRVIEQYKEGKLTTRIAYNSRSQVIQRLHYDEEEAVTRIEQFEYNAAGKIARYTRQSPEWKLQQERLYEYNENGVLTRHVSRDLQTGKAVEQEAVLTYAGN